MKAKPAYNETLSQIELFIGPGSWNAMQLCFHYKGTYLKNNYHPVPMSYIG